MKNKVFLLLCAASLMFAQTNYPVVGSSGTGNVVGPASVTDGQATLFNTGTGKLLKAQTQSGVMYHTAGVPAPITGTASNVIKVDGSTQAALDPVAGGSITGAIDMSAGRFKMPRQTFASPPSSPLTYQQFLFTDAITSGTCTGGGSAFAVCMWDGTSWVAVGGGCGGGLPGNTAASVLFNTGSAWVSRIMSGFTDNGATLVGDGTFLEGAGNNQFTGLNAFVPGSIQTLTASSGSCSQPIICDRTTVQVQPTAACTATATPTIAAGTYNGQMCYVVNAGAPSPSTTANLTLNSFTLPYASKLRLHNNQTTLGGGQRIAFMWNTVADAWIQDGTPEVAVLPSAPYTIADVSTPSNPASSNTSYYAKGGKLCALNPSGVETCTQPAQTWPAGGAGIPQYNGASGWGTTLTLTTDGTLAGNSDTNIPSEQSIKTYAAAKVSNGTATLGTTLIAANTCATVVSVTATGVVTTDVIMFTPNADITGVTGYTPAGSLVIFPYPSSGHVNFKVCNKDQSNSVTPGAVTLNWRVSR